MPLAATLKAYLDLCRVSNLPTVWTNVLAAGLLAIGGFQASGFLLLAVALSAFYLAGMALNDLWDLEHDRRHRPGRPLPSGRVSVAVAWRLVLGLFALGLALLALAPDPRGLAGGMALILAIVAYDRHHKGNPYSVLLMAACRGLVYLTVALALTGQVAAPVWLGAGVQFAWVIVISLTARRENRLPRGFGFPVVPALIAGIALVDGLLLAVLVSPPWLLAGVLGAWLTWLGQRYVRGD